MDLDLDSDLIRNERRKRGWSQEQLAAAAGLSVRTIQRVESSGTASCESAKCLAAVFEMTLASLSAETRTPPRTLARHWVAAAAACAALVSSLILMSRANATDVAMAVVVTSAITGESRMNLEVASGRQTEIKLDKDLRVLLTPSLRADGTILLAAELYGWDGSEFRLAGKPRVLLRQGTETGLRLDLEGGRSANLRIVAKQM